MASLVLRCVRLSRVLCVCRVSCGVSCVVSCRWLLLLGENNNTDKGPTNYSLLTCTQCKFLTGVINQIIQWLAAELTPIDICQRLHLCNATAPIPMASVTESKSLELLTTLLRQKAQFLAQNQ